MLNISPEKLLLLLLIALVVLGPNRLPQAARTIGKTVANLRRLSGSFQTEVREALAEPHDALAGAVGDLGLDDLRDTLRDVRQVTSTVTNPIGAVTKGLAGPFNGALGNPEVATATPAGAPPTAAEGAARALGSPVNPPTPSHRAATTDLPPPPDDPSLN